MKEEAACPCGSGHNFAGCCGPYLEQGQLPATAEALMRSRYSAFALGNVAYLKNSWHPSTAPKELSLHTTPSWCGLEIVATSAGSKDDDEGMVEFKAHYLSQGRLGILHEKSRFVREKGRWYYVSGDLQDAEPQAAKVGRNDPCPCGSGKKFKQCCMK